jgi:hypothetical protein
VAQFRKAVIDKHLNVLIWAGKVRLGQRERREVDIVAMGGQGYAFSGRLDWRAERASGHSGAAVGAFWRVLGRLGRR